MVFVERGKYQSAKQTFKMVEYFCDVKQNNVAKVNKRFYSFHSSAPGGGRKDRTKNIWTIKTEAEIYLQENFVYLHYYVTYIFPIRRSKFLNRELLCLCARRLGEFTSPR
jgi:hypothetical protein